MNIPVIQYLYENCQTNVNKDVLVGIFSPSFNLQSWSCHVWTVSLLVVGIWPFKYMPQAGFELGILAWAIEWTKKQTPWPLDHHGLIKKLSKLALSGVFKLLLTCLVLWYFICQNNVCKYETKNLISCQSTTESEKTGQNSHYFKKPITKFSEGFFFFFFF